MKKMLCQTQAKHSLEVLYYSSSKMLERASYYGLRAIFILYMLGATLKLETDEAVKIYGWFTTAIILSPILGGLVGDLLVGNKKTILIGGIIQALGAFSMCIPYAEGLYIALVLVALGSGLYSPNLTANFGKSYLKKTTLLDSGFTILYLAINLGSFLGALLIGSLADTYGYSVGFVFSGVLMLFSLIPILISKENKIEVVKRSKKAINRSVINIVIALMASALFWAIYELSSTWSFKLQTQLTNISSHFIPTSLWQTVNVLILIAISIILAIVWTFSYKNPFFKLMIGFLFGALSFGILLYIPEVPTEQDVIVFFVSMILLGIAEVHISPILHTVLTKYSNPKYLAIFMSLALLPTRLSSMIIGLYRTQQEEHPLLVQKICIIALVVIWLGLMVFVVWNKKQQEYLQKNNCS